MKSVLFLCTGNSARSIMAEAILNHLGRGRFKAHSAGRRPTGRVNPLAKETLREMNIDTRSARSKSWDEFATPGAPAVDLVITVCDSTARETCPVWPGKPANAHWSIEDPAAVEELEARRRAFRDAANELRARIEKLVG